MTSQNKSKNMNRRLFIKTTGFAGIYMAASVPSCNNTKKKAAKLPNIIFLLTDDQRYDAMGCMGNPIIRTPNMDRLASMGVLFENNFVTTSICCSSRASILSGQYTRRHGIIDFRKDFTPSALAQTYPLLMRNAGYRTGFIGKWGVGRNLPAGEFDYFKGFPGQGKYFHDENGRQIHLTKIMGTQAVEFIRDCSREQPFCLSVSFKAPHVQDNDPRQFLYDPAFENLYKNVAIPLPKTADPRNFEMLPEFIRNSEARRRWNVRFSTPEKYQESVKGYYRLIYGIDVVIGRITDTLKELNFDDNTIIIFSSDNGFYLGEHGLAGKWFMHEESIRTPLIIYDPRLSSSLRGKRRKEIVLNIDIAPTILEMSGLDIHSAIQGRSLNPLVNGETIPWRHDFLYEHLFEHKGIAKTEGVRTERWKYFQYVDMEPVYEELYDLENDRYEEHNIVKSNKHKEILNSLRTRLQELRESVR